MATTTRKRPEKRVSGPENWEQWSAHLSRRESPLAPWRLIPSRKGNQLRWGLPEEAFSADTERLLAKLESWMDKAELKSAKVIKWLEPWLAAVEGRKADLGFALECLGWTYLLPKLAAVLPAAPWGEVFDCLTDVARRSVDHEFDHESDGALVEQILAGELPLTLAYQFPENPECSSLGVAGRSRLKAGLKEMIDGNGLPHCRYLGVVRPLLACWTRGSYLARATRRLAFSGKMQLRFEWYLRQCLQLTRPDGGLVLSNGTTYRAEAELFDAALLLVGDPVDMAIADQVLPGRKASRCRSQRKTFFPDSADHSAWSRLAILRPNWLRGGPQLAVAYGEGTMQTELTCGRETVWSGAWETRVTADGTLLQPRSAWEEVCWHTDDDVDYLELELELSDDWRMQRQFVMAREDQFLFVADALVGPAPAEIEYTSCLPLSQHVRFVPQDETREGTLIGHRRPVGRVLPLAMPEWRTLQFGGDLNASQTGLCQIRQAQAQRLYAPIFIDLDRRRSKRSLTWRRLTVAERLEIVDAETAVAYRVQIGGEQWVFFRSLTATESRTFLGQHLHDDFFAGRFDRDGEVDELISIRASE